MTEQHVKKLSSTADYDEGRSKKLMSKKRILKNLIILSTGNFLLFTAYDGPVMLQSTMNQDQGIGVASQAILYGCFSLSALVLPKYVITKFGSKATYVASMMTYIPYIASNFYPHWTLMIPASILIGLGAALVWGSQANYLNDISVMYAEHSISTKTNISIVNGAKPSKHSYEVEKRDSNPQSFSKTLSYFDENDIKQSGAIEKVNCSIENSVTDNNPHNKESNSVVFYGRTLVEGSRIATDASNLQGVTAKPPMDLTIRSKTIEAITARFFGIHGMAFFVCQLLSNLLSYYVLKGDAVSTNHSSTIRCVCGAIYCNVESKCFDENLAEPSNETRYILTTICFSLAVFSVVVIAFLLDPVESKPGKVSFSLQLLMATYKLGKRKELLLLIPFSFYVGQFQGFYTAEFTKAYVGCSWGIYHVSLVTVCYGGLSAISSNTAGWLVKRLGRRFILTLAALLNIALIILLLMWQPSAEESEVFFIASGMSGAYIGIAWSQIRAFYGVLFKADEEAAFAAFHFWYALGYGLSFAYSGYFCTYVKIYILLGISSFGYIGYMIVEKIHPINSKK